MLRILMFLCVSVLFLQDGNQMVMKSPNNGSYYSVIHDSRTSESLSEILLCHDTHRSPILDFLYDMQLCHNPHMPSNPKTPDSPSEIVEYNMIVEIIFNGYIMLFGVITVMLMIACFLSICSLRKHEDLKILV